MSYHSIDDAAEVPEFWRVNVTGSGPSPFKDGSVIQLRQLENGPRWELAIRPDPEGLFEILGTLTRQEGVWSGTVTIGDDAEFVACAIAPAAGERIRPILFGIVLDLGGGAGQEQGTWGAEEEGGFGEDDSY